VLRAVGVLPVRDHYYEPLIDARHLRHPLDRMRALPGIDFAPDGQLAFIGGLRHADELRELARAPSGRPGEYYLDNDTFGAGDADVWYALVRTRKPRRIVEIGSGHSTLVARLAIARNTLEDPAYACTHVCIEPYEKPWLESTGVEVRRERVEDVGAALFATLNAGDVLFIDSSHVIRPQGDVLTEYLEILPVLKPGVLVHIHDIFTPRDYPARWVVDSALLWNEQYLVEAFLTGNGGWKVRAGLNYLYWNHREALAAACPCLSPDVEPGSLYIERVE
jgi:hypothetical protein